MFSLDISVWVFRYTGLSLGIELSLLKTWKRGSGRKDFFLFFSRTSSPGSAAAGLLCWRFAAASFWAGACALSDGPVVGRPLFVAGATSVGPRRFSSSTTARAADGSQTPKPARRS